MIKSQLDALQFVLRNDDKGMVPAFSQLHFYGEEGRVQTTSGTITFDAPWPGNPLAVTVPMQPVIKCMQAAPDEKARIVVNKRGDLMIKVADYSSKLLPFQGEYPLMDKMQAMPENSAAIPADYWNKDVMNAIDLLRPFVSDDATRPWSQYMLLRAGKLYATNNVAITRFDLPDLEFIGHDVLLDVGTIDHILRIRSLGHDVSRIRLNETELLCEFSDGAWTAYRSSAVVWPDVSRFDAALCEGEEPVPENMAEKIQTIGSIASTKPEGAIYLYEHGAMAQMETTSARVWCGAFKRSAFMRSSLQQALGVAEKWTVSLYPAPVPFSGKGVLGVLLGIREASDMITTLLQGDVDDA